MIKPAPTPTLDETLAALLADAPRVQAANPVMSKSVQRRLAIQLSKPDAAEPRPSDPGAMEPEP